MYNAVTVMADGSQVSNSHLDLGTLEVVKARLDQATHWEDLREWLQVALKDTAHQANF